MTRTPDLDRYDLATVAAVLLPLGAFARVFFWYTLDDAYITLRYAKHLADGAGLLWNRGGEPVEGYTSFLWVVLGGVADALGLAPVRSMKLLGVAATATAVVVLYAYGRWRGVDRWLLAVGAAHLTASPAVAVLSVQGMETTTAMLLVLVSTVAALELARAYRRRWAVVLNVALVLGMFARPGLVVFAVTLEAALAGVLVARGRAGEVQQLVGWGAVLAGIPGVAYMVGRTAYFGYPLPNPFYVKTSSGVLSTVGSIMVFEFVMLVLGPLLFVTLFGAVVGRRPERVTAAAFVPLAATATFLVPWLFIDPRQGFLWRFQTPVLAAAVLSVVVVLDDIAWPADGAREALAAGGEQVRAAAQSPSPLGRSPDGSVRLPGVDAAAVVRAAAVLVLVAGLVVHPVFSYPDAVAQTEQSTPGDRVVMGQALGGLDGDYRMFVTESGATPYYSDWTAVDEWGLNSERIAHRGLSASYLQRYDPHLVQLLVRVEPAPIRRKSPPTARFLDDSPYRLAAAVHRQNADGSNVRPDRYHLYFVDSASPAADRITCTVVTQDLVYADRATVVALAEIEVTMANHTAAGC